MGDIDYAALAAPFDPSQVHWRVGSTTKDKQRGLALAYLDARDVMDRLDAVCGPENWSNHYEFHGSRTLCTLTINGVGKTDGAGDTDIEGEKGGISDALKRAAVLWGIGRYLYRCDSPWVDLKNGKYIASGQEAKLAKALKSINLAPAPPIEAVDPTDHVPETEPAEMDTGDRPAGKPLANESERAQIQKAIGPRCRDVDVAPNEYGPIIEVWAVQQNGFPTLEDVTQDAVLDVIETIGRWSPGDEGDDGDLPF